jgi:predicted TIM-barrel fold metal-dependent hydrolase
MGELEPCRDEYRDRNVRLAVMDRQGLDGAFFFPTLGVGIEEFMRDDPEACAVAFHSFNQWLFDDWGFGADGRIFGVPYIPLGVPDRAVEMLQWALDHGAKAFNMRAAPVATFRGETHSPADPRLDRFWGLVNESGILCAIHSGDSGYLKYANDWEPQTHFEAFRQNPFAALFMADRSSMDVCAALISHRLFESGSMWVPELFRRFKKVFSQNPKAFAEDPRLTFQRHIYVSPFFEDDIPGLVELIGTDHVLFGSDYPHVEGLAEPTDYVFDLKGLDDLQIRMIMRDNFRNLLGLA